MKIYQNCEKVQPTALFGKSDGSCPLRQARTAPQTLSSARLPGKGGNVGWRPFARTKQTFTAPVPPKIAAVVTEATVGVVSAASIAIFNVARAKIYQICGKVQLTTHPRKSDRSCSLTPWPTPGHFWICRSRRYWDWIEASLGPREGPNSPRSIPRGSYESKCRTTATGSLEAAATCAP